MKKLHKYSACLFAFLFCFSLNAAAFTAGEVSGTGPYPYNFHLIDDHVYAGGHPLNPRTGFNNSDEQVAAILACLRSLGVRSVINLENTRSIQARYQRSLQAAGLTQLHVPLSLAHLPDQKEWEKISAAMRQPVYIHCKWGADRTGAVVGRYLVEKYQFTPEQAYRSVISGGKYAGPIGGLKTAFIYHKLKNFIWEGPQWKRLRSAGSSHNLR